MVRFVCPPGVVLFLLLLVLPSAAAADDRPVSLREAAEAAGAQLAAADRVAAPAVPRRSRPGALMPLYVSFAALQVLDTHSTSRALTRGAVEANPLMKGIAGNELGMIALKAAGTAGVIYVNEKMWKRNKAAAVIFMVAANSAMAYVVQSNYRAVR